MDGKSSGEAPSLTHGLGGATGDTWVDHFKHVHWTGTVPLLIFAGVVVASIVYYWCKDVGARGVGGPVGGLNYVVGPMGSGKSMFGVRKIAAALRSDTYVVTNVKLLPGWAGLIVDQHYGFRIRRDRARRARAVARLEGFYVYEKDLRRAMRYRPPCAVCGLDVRTCGHVGPEQEGRAIFVWDESHNDLNNRDYQGHGTDRQERDQERERRRLVVRWATQLRKIGFVGYLLSQHHENTDAQLRRVCNFIIRLQNQRNAEGVWIARLLPRRLTLFLVYWYPAHLADGKGDHALKASRRERYWLPWERHLYDSWETFHGVDELDGEDSPIVLPAGGRPNPEPGAPRLRGVGSTGPAAAPPSPPPPPALRASSSQ